MTSLNPGDIRVLVWSAFPQRCYPGSWGNVGIQVVALLMLPEGGLGSSLPGPAQSVTLNLQGTSWAM